MSGRKPYLFAFFLIFLAAVPVSAQNGKRYALVIGNANYQRIPSLQNTVNDAEDIAAALKSLDYTVDLRKNIRRRDMVSAITAFTRRLAADKTSEGFFWYAGHAVRLADENYLLPVNISLDEDAIKADSFPFNELLSLLERAQNTANVVVLDACRNNPFPGSYRGPESRGLSVVSDGNIPGSTLIMYSTRAGDVASDGEPGERNSPFAKAFLRNINSREPLALMVIDVTRDTLSLTGGRQEPWSSGRMTDKDYTLLPGIQKGVLVDAFGSLEITSVTGGILRIQGPQGAETVEMSDGGIYFNEQVRAGRYTITVTYSDGSREIKYADVGRSQTAQVGFDYRIPLPSSIRLEATGSINITAATAGTLHIRGPQQESITIALSDKVTYTSRYLLPGAYTLTLKYSDGTEETKEVEVNPSVTASVSFAYRIPPPKPPKPTEPVAPRQPDSSSYEVVDGGLAGGMTLGGLVSGGGTFGYDFARWGFQGGFYVSTNYFLSIFFLAEAGMGVTSGGTIKLWEGFSSRDIMPYYFGVLFDLLFDNVMFGFGAGMGGGILSSQKFAYIRGAVTFCFDDTGTGITAFYEHHFTVGFRLGLQLTLRWKSQ